MKRRDFLQTLGGTTLAAMAHPGALAGSPVRSRLLVLVELKGGNDGLNTVVPYTDPTYYRLRPTLAIGRDAVLPLDSRLGLHPSLAPLMPLWRARRDGDSAGDRLSRTPASPTFVRRRSGIAPPAAVDVGSRTGSTRALGSNRRQLRFSPDGQCLDPVAVAWGNRTAAQPSTHILHGEFPPGDFGRAVRTTCEALARDAAVDVIRLALDGFDTHQNQAPRHAAILGELSNGLIALRAGLMELGRWDSTLVLTLFRVRSSGSGKPIGWYRSWHGSGAFRLRGKGARRAVRQGTGPQRTR